jgi:lariat debranching enzyme
MSSGGREMQHRGSYHGPRFHGQFHRSSGRHRGRGQGRGGRFGRGPFRQPSSNKSVHREPVEINVQDDLVKIQEVGASDGSNVRIAIQGCSHGALDRIYDTLALYEQYLIRQEDEVQQEKKNHKIDLLLCCGDFQALRNELDLEGMAVPQKYKEMGTFYKYYAGIKKAPILTIFVGGNHEASSYLQELYYGGWVAPNIYYLGACGVVRYKGIRIAGISGIYKPHDYRMGRYERPPYDHSSLRSVYHVRNFEMAKLKVLEKIHDKKYGTSNKSPVVDIMLSHDWPRGIEQHGDTAGLIRRKTFFQQEIKDNNLGSPCNEDLLVSLRPKWWFAAHLHVKFEAVYHHKTPINNESIPFSHASKQSEIASNTSFIALESSERSSTICSETVNEDLTEQMTRFLSLDKCLPRRHHLQVTNISYHDQSQENVDCHLHYDEEWLAVLQKTHDWTRTSKSNFPDPDVDSIDITESDIQSIQERLAEISSEKDPTIIPSNFVMTVQPFGTIGSTDRINGGRMIGNPQTDYLLNMLNLNHIVTVPYIYKVDDDKINPNGDENEINLDMDDDSVDGDVKIASLQTDEYEISLDDASSEDAD